MATFTFTSLAHAAREIARRERERERRVKLSVRKAARATLPDVRKNIPRAFAELEDSLHVEDLVLGRSDIIADAPHAAAVEKGTRPHMPPLEPLIAWVTLRGLRGMTRQGGVKSNRTKGGEVKDPKAEASRVIATALRGKMGRQGAARWATHMGNLLAVSSKPRANLGAAEADPAVVEIARAIQHTIAKRGTKPARYMLSSMSAAEGHLARFVQEALQDK